MMTLKSLTVLLAATALGVGALAYSGPADAYARGCGWHRGRVVASDYDVAPRRTCHSGCVVASDYVAPRYYEPTYYTKPVVYTSAWSWPWGYGSGWPF
ncbi:MAG: hypothetical protein WBS22_19555 [Methylocystis sp.]